MITNRKQFSSLGQPALEKIHQASLRLLEKTGLLVHDAELRGILRRAGARVDADGLTVRLPPDLVRETLAQAPRRFEVVGRDGTRLPFPAVETYQTSRGKMPQWLDYERHQVRLPTVQDVANLAKLCQALPSVDLLYIVDCPCADVPDEANWVATAEAIYLNTVKPLEIAPIHRLSAEVWVEMGEAAMGQPSLSAPTATVNISTTNLQLDHDSAQAMIYCVQKGIPLITLPIPMAGAVAPFTLAGAVLAHNVEALFLIAAAQAIRPGAPVIYGGIPHVMNMPYGHISFGAPEMSLCNAAVIALARYYGLPGYHCTAYTDSALPEFQAGAEKMLEIYSTLLSGADMALVGTLDNSTSTSLEIVVMDNDAWEAAERATREIEVSEDTLAEEVIARVGPGGSYLADDHTLRWLRSGEHYYGGSFNRQGGLDESRTMWARASRRAAQLIAGPSAVPAAVAGRVRAGAGTYRAAVGM